ncbi:flagellar filament capping protein FliD [Chitinimonas koreensis]|nr:flagellar filament capping protein FliD [Chitinimonas koreensis]
MNLYSITDTMSRAYGALGAPDGVRQSYGLGNISSIRQDGSDNRLRLPSSTTVRLSDYGKLQSGLAELRRAVGALDSDDEVAAVTARSDSDAVSAAITAAEALPASAEVEVLQRARSQQVESGLFADRDETIVGTGVLTIDTGRFNASAASFGANDASARSVRINITDGTLGGIANAINRAGAGVTASVKQDGDQYRLELTGKATGANQAFRVRVDDDEGNDTDNAQGLSRLAFDPTLPAGGGQNLVQIRRAEDAELKVDGRAVSSGSNTVTDAIGGASLQLASNGRARLDFGRDEGQATRSAKSLVDAVNRFRDQAGNLQADGLSRRIGTDLDLALSGAQSGSGLNGLALADVGITRASNGTLRFDEARFKQAFAQNGEGVGDLLANAAERIGTASDKAINGPLREATGGIRVAGQNGDNPYVAQARQLQLQNLFGNQPTLLPYSPTTRNLYGLAQYLAVAGL